jgi:hypothetical protein
VTHKRTVPTAAQKVDRLATLAEQARQVSSDPELSERLGRTAAAILKRNHDDIGADAILYAARVILSKPNLDDERHLAALALHKAKQYQQARAAVAPDAGTAAAPFPLDDERLALDDLAELDADPQNRHRHTLASLTTEAAPQTMERLREQSRREFCPLPAEIREPQTPASKQAEQVTRWASRHDWTAGDADALNAWDLINAQRAAKVAAHLYRYGVEATTKHSAPMTVRPAGPSTGPATPVITAVRRVPIMGEHGPAIPTHVDGVPIEEAAAQLGMPDATPEQVAAAALAPWGDGTHIKTHLTPDADAVPLAQVRRENADDKRRHEAAQPVKKPNPRKRPRSGRLGTSATIR